MRRLNRRWNDEQRDDPHEDWIHWSREITVNKTVALDVLSQAVCELSEPSCYLFT
jgi:hypothetical protein